MSAPQQQQQSPSVASRLRRAVHSLLPFSSSPAAPAEPAEPTSAMSALYPAADAEAADDMPALPAPEDGEHSDGAAEDADQKPAAEILAAMPAVAVPSVLTVDALGFDVAPAKRKSPQGVPLCTAVGCPKRSQANTKVDGHPGGFCRSHHNMLLIRTGRTASWECHCGNRVAESSDRCGQCHRWKAGKQPVVGERKKPKRVNGAPVDGSGGDGGAKKKAKKERKPRASYGGGPDNANVNIVVPPTVAISGERKTNDKGRALCKVVGCTKLDQARNFGFCRMHFNMCAVGEGDAAGGEEGAAGSAATGIGVGADDDSNWKCDCGHTISVIKKRCGKCNKWRGGKRDPYTTTPKKKSAKKESPADGSEMPSLPTAEEGATATPEDAAIAAGDEDADGVPLADDWTCKCGKVIAAKKSRCGACHAWRGGKRKGGWKLKAKSADGGGATAASPKKPRPAVAIDWTQDWTCCEAVIPAKKTRCGKCNGWRGGTRVTRAEREAAMLSPTARVVAEAAQESVAAAMATAEESDEGETTYI